MNIHKGCTAHSKRGVTKAKHFASALAHARVLGEKTVQLASRNCKLSIEVILGPIRKTERERGGAHSCVCLPVC